MKGGELVTKEVHKVVRQSGKRRIIIANSATSLDENNKNDITVVGSHCGWNIADYVFKAGARGLIGNDAGIGLENAGIACFKRLEERGIPAAAVATMSAEIGVGESTYNDGVISAANKVAKKMGVVAGMPAKEAANKMFEGMS